MIVFRGKYSFGLNEQSQFESCLFTSVCAIDKFVEVFTVAYYSLLQVHFSNVTHAVYLYQYSITNVICLLIHFNQYNHLSMMRSNEKLETK